MTTTVTFDIIDGGSHETLFKSIGSSRDFQIKLGLRLRLRSEVKQQKLEDLGWAPSCWEANGEIETTSKIRGVEWEDGSGKKFNIAGTIGPKSMSDKSSRFHAYYNTGDRIGFLTLDSSY